MTTIGHAILVRLRAAIGLFLAVLVVMGFFRLPGIAARARVRLGEMLHVQSSNLQARYHRVRRTNWETWLIVGVVGILVLMFLVGALLR